MVLTISRIGIHFEDFTEVSNLDILGQMMAETWILKSFVNSPIDEFKL